MHCALVEQPWQRPPTHVSPPVHWALLVQAFEHVPSAGVVVPPHEPIEPQSAFEKHAVLFDGTHPDASGVPEPVQLRDRVHCPELTHCPLAHCESDVQRQAVCAALHVPVAQL